MTTRFVKGKARTETPRSKDLARVLTGRDRTDERSSDGRFTAGNGAATGRGAKSLIRESLGSEHATAEAIRDVMTMYRALVRESPSDSPNIRGLIASRCRHAWLATQFMNEAFRVGLSTDEGMKLADRSRNHDLAAQRLAVTTSDLATKEAIANAKARPEDHASKLFAAFGAPALPTEGESK